MPKFINLTEKRSSGREVPLMLNVDNINSVKSSEKGPDTHINMTDGHYFFVTETVEDIQKMVWLMEKDG